jgi:hypothetical protein
MTIRVQVEGWQQECCGEPFAVGDRVEWMLRAVTTPAGPEYVEDHHGGDDGGDPPTVAGRIVGIESLHQPVAPAPGQRPFHVPVGTPHRERLERVEKGSFADDYEVAFDPEPAAVLPDPVEPWVNHDAIAEDARQREAAEGPVGRALTALADAVSADHAGRVTLATSDTGAGVTLTPTAEGAADVLWTLRTDRITVLVGEGEWTLPADDRGVARLRSMIAAAVEGRVEYRVARPKRRGPSFAEVELTGSGEAVFRREIRGFGSRRRGGFSVMPGGDYRALSRGTERARPW